MTSAMTPNHPPGELQGRSALITGGAGAIGRAIANGFLRSGAQVTLIDIRQDALKTLARELEGIYGGENVLALEADVRDSPSVQRAFEAALEKFGRLDILVNNAAATQIMAVDEVADEDIDRIVDTNLKGYIKCAREAVAIMKRMAIRGVLLFVSSKNGLEGASEKSLYCATKGGELTLARALARELGPSGIRVNSVCPDAVLKGSALWEDRDYWEGTCRRYNITREQIPDHYAQRCALKTTIDPEDVAEAALFLASDRSAKITGAILSVDGGVAYVR